MVSSGVGVLDGSQRAAREGGLGVFGSFLPISLNCTLLSRNVLDSCVKSLHYFHTDSILLEMSFHWLYDDVVRFKIEGGVYTKLAKM